MRRVVVTGLGLVTPLGDGVEANWRRLIAGESGIRGIDRFEVADLPSRIAGMVPAKDAPGGFDPDRYLAPKEQRKISLFILYAVAAAAQAVRDAGLDGELSDDVRERIGVQVGSGIGGLPEIYDTSITLHDKGPRRVSPFFIPSALINLASGNISIRYGFKGPNHSAVTACATGAHAIGDAGRMIALGDADVMVAGGAEAALCRLAVAGFAASRALTHHFNDTPERASRPWDQDRDGFTIAEGAGVVILEDREHALARGATIYAELAGYGMSGDAHHITAPAPDGDGGFRAMRAALANARLGVGDIDYVNAHGTSTPLGDEIELGAVKRLFGDHAYRLSMSSTKSAIGHLLGAAGAVEAIYTILALKDGVLPPTRNLDAPSAGCDLDLVPHEAKRREVRAALSNAFGFGGTNSSLIFTRAEP
ncbi:MAG: beta-ketoacyl-ACP synthase II [Alphaproteobacteria bacterium]|jgi:3-oxoacyl-[acyl-carrier-protein] synthase II|nr:beta-ketoacyl-ACP synthase II [Alphaproteobacteria bacterium]